IRIAARVLLRDVHAGDDQSTVRSHRQHFTATAFVAPGDDDHFVFAFDLAHRSLLRASLYSTSGASEMIRMKLSVRSSRVTGTKIRVHTGCICGVNNTAAF